jgi:hypothetical protein
MRINWKREKRERERKQKTRIYKDYVEGTQEMACACAFIPSKTRHFP